MTIYSKTVVKTNSFLLLRKETVSSSGLTTYIQSYVVVLGQKEGKIITIDIYLDSSISKKTKYSEMY